MKKDEIKIGLKFKYISSPTSYWISDIVNRDVIVSWYEDDQIVSTDYSLNQVEQWFEKGTWKIIE